MSAATVDVSVRCEEMPAIWRYCEGVGVGGSLQDRLRAWEVEVLCERGKSGGGC